jgi:predicted HTH domain antitoxin
MARTMSVRMDEENYEFLRRLSKEEKADLSAAVRELVDKGRIMLAVERYRDGKASLGRAAELAGVQVGDMIEILSRYGVESNLQSDDYRKGLEQLRKLW